MEVTKASQSAFIEDRIAEWAYQFARGIIILVLGYIAIISLYGQYTWHEIITWMEYPKYVMHFVGMANLIAILALLVPDFPRLAEWTYAGITIELLLAGYSHIRVGDVYTLTFFPFAFLAVVMSSYLLRPAFRGKIIPKRRRLYDLPGQMDNRRSDIF